MDDELIGLLRHLVGIPSLNPYRTETDDPRYGEAALADHVAAVASEAGLAVERQDAAPGRPNVLATLPGPLGGPPLLFVAHMDTVPVEGMTIDPFAAEVRDGRLYGRGACDNKGSLAAILTALRRVAAASANAHPIVFLATADEESGFRGVRRFLADSPPVAMAFIGEPTRLQLITAHRGVARYLITTHGKSAHSATPGQGVNAVYRMAPLVAALETLAAELEARPPHPLTGPPSLSVGTIHGGHSVNTVPDHCSIEVDRRLMPGETPDVAESAIRAIAEERGATVDAFLAVPPFEVPTDSEVVRRASAAVEAETGRAEIIGARYCTEAAGFASAGIPAVVLGPGDPKQAHSADEWVALDQVEAACRVYERIMSADA